MNTLLRKMNFKDQKSILVLNAPDAFEAELIEFKEQLTVNNKLDNEPISFCLIFAENRIVIETFAPKIDAIMTNNGLFWWAYPKKSSKKYKSDITRDNGWQIMGEMGYEPVRMVAIDDDWSALRFKKAENIKTLSRNPSWIMSEEGKNKVK